MMNKQNKALVGLILLNILCLTVGIGIAEEGDAGAVPDGLARVVALETPTLTDEYLIVSIKATAPIQYLEPVLQQPDDGVPMVVYVDLPNIWNDINGGRTSRVKLTELLTPPASLPVSRVIFSQFQPDPPVCRIVFYIKEPIEPIVVAEGTELHFRFPLSRQETNNLQKKPDPNLSKEPVVPESTIDNSLPESAVEEQKPSPNPREEAIKSPTLTGINTVLDTRLTRVRLLANAPLKIEYMKWVSDSGSPEEEILEIRLPNTVVSETLLQTSALSKQKGIIHRITLDAIGVPSPSCTVRIYLAHRVFYEVSHANEGNQQEKSPYELEIVFENPLLDRIVTIKSEHEPLRKLLFILFQQYGANFITDEDVQLDEQVTFYLENVPLRVALDQILNSRGYGYEEMENGILRIKSLGKIMAAREASNQPEPIPTKELSAKTFHLQHAPVANVKTALESLISSAGEIVTDERTRSIIVIDTKEQLEKVESLLNETIQTLDQEVPSALESKETVEQAPPPQPIQRVIRLSYADPEQLKEILSPHLTPEGTIQSFEAYPGGGPGGGGGGAGGSGGGSGGGMGGNELGQAVGSGGYLVITDTPDAIAAIERAVAEWDVPTPQVDVQVHIIESDLSNGLNTSVDWTAVDKEQKATLSMSSNAGGQLQIGRLTAAEFTAVLNAISTESNTRLLSNPHITVVENQTAQFHSGEEVPFRKIAIQQGIEQVEIFFKSVGILLNVMAQVKPDNRINLLVNAQVSSVGEQTSIGEPAINTRNARTQMLVPDGDTVVIGGLTRDSVIETVSRVPILGHIPLLGQLFSSRQHTKSRNEITIYLTPRIVRE